jgi:hypothetical protein
MPKDMAVFALARTVAGESKGSGRRVTVASVPFYENESMLIED